MEIEIFKDLDKYYDEYSLGRGLNLGQAFNLVPWASTYDRYLGYNTIARDQSQLPKALVALQDILLTRGIVYLASGRGVSDSAQLLFLNGKIMSMWDIIQYAMYNDIGVSSGSSSSKNGIYMSLGKQRSKIINSAKSSNWHIRIVDTNDAINSAVMKLEIVPKKIIDYVNSKT